MRAGTAFASFLLAVAIGGAAWIVTLRAGPDALAPVDATTGPGVEIERLRAENDRLRQRLEMLLGETARSEVPHLGGRPPPPSRPAPVPPSEGPARGPPPGTPEAPIPFAVSEIPVPGGVQAGAPDPGGLLRELAKRGDVGVLLADVARDPTVDLAVRVRAVAAILSTHADDALALVEELRTSREPSDRRVAFGVLSSVRDARLAPEIRRALEGPDRPEDVPPLAEALARAKGPSWGSAQATGAADTFEAGDKPTAWASKQGDMGEVWLELDYETAVIPDGVRVYETFNAGAVTRVEAKRADGSGYEVLWEGDAPAALAPHVFEPPLARSSGLVRTIRLVLDTNRVPGWNEIDAVELIGDGASQWAVEARASSSYGGS